jgi:hypothetical protein
MRTCKCIDREGLIKEALKEYLYTIYKNQTIRNKFGKTKIDFKSRLIKGEDDLNEKDEKFKISWIGYDIGGIFSDFD